MRRRAVRWALITLTLVALAVWAAESRAQTPWPPFGSNWELQRLADEQEALRLQQERQFRQLQLQQYFRELREAEAQRERQHETERRGFLEWHPAVKDKPWLNLGTEADR